MKLAETAAVVTGAAGNFGRAISETLAREGARVALLDRNRRAVESLASWLQSEGVDVHPIAVDLTDEAAVGAATKEAIRKYGRLQVLVNSAAVIMTSRLEDMPMYEFDRLVALNIRGTFMVTQAVGRHMIANGGGAIVNLASTAAQIADPTHGVYAITKAAIVSMTLQVAVEWGPHHVRCNTVSPGPATTSMFNATPPDGPPFELRREHSKSVMPLRELAEPMDVAQAVLFLASPEARHITGVNLTVDSGYSPSIQAVRAMHFRQWLARRE